MWLRRILIATGIGAGVSFLAVIIFIVVALQGLPSLEELQRYEPPITTRVHAGDGALVAEFADEHRVFVPIAAIPSRVQDAFVAVEDKRFFEHSGIDYQGVARAVLAIPGAILSGRRPQGASTITQQVAGNMLTGRAASCRGGGIGGIICQVYTKLREGLVAQRIEKAFPDDAGKRRILELYLNQIYLGNRSYGVAAAALNYFNKSLSELSVGEAAYLAALPQGPALYHPTRHPEAARNRRNLVVGRMLEAGYITAEEAEAARAEELVTTDRLSGAEYVASAHFVEELRRQVLRDYGERELQRGGLSIRSTLDTRLQLAAARALRSALEGYDRRHAWRGPISNGDAAGDIQAQLRESGGSPALSNWRRAMVTRVQGNRVTVTVYRPV
jgi:penicillin-binding protein 1A